MAFPQPPFPGQFIQAPPIHWDAPFSGLPYGTTFHQAQHSLPPAFLPVAGPLGMGSPTFALASPTKTRFGQPAPPFWLRPERATKKAKSPLPAVSPRETRKPQRAYVVRLPVERGLPAEGRSISLWTRIPLGGEAAVHSPELDTGLETTSCALHPEERAVSGKLPPTMDIYLPGWLGWLEYLEDHGLVARHAQGIAARGPMPPRLDIESLPAPPLTPQTYDLLTPSPLFVSEAAFPLPPTHRPGESLSKPSLLSADVPEFHPRESIKRRGSELSIEELSAGFGIAAEDIMAPMVEAKDMRSSMTSSIGTTASAFSSDLPQTATSSQATLSDAEVKAVRSAAVATLHRARRSREDWLIGGLEVESIVSNPSDEEPTVQHKRRTSSLNVTAPIFQPRPVPAVAVKEVEQLVDWIAGPPEEGKKDEEQMRSYRFPPSPPQMASSKFDTFGKRPPFAELDANASPMTVAKPEEAVGDLSWLRPTESDASGEVHSSAASLQAVIADRFDRLEAHVSTLSRDSQAGGLRSEDVLGPIETMMSSLRTLVATEPLNVEALTEHLVARLTEVLTRSSTDGKLDEVLDILRRVEGEQAVGLQESLQTAKDDAEQAQEEAKGLRIRLDEAEQALSAASKELEAVKAEAAVSAARVIELDDPRRALEAELATSRQAAQMVTDADSELKEMRKTLSSQSQDVEQRLSSLRTAHEGELRLLKESGVAKDAQIEELRRRVGEQDARLEALAVSSGREAALKEQVAASKAAQEELRVRCASLEQAAALASFKADQALATAKQDIDQLRREIERQEEVAISTSDVNQSLDWESPELFDVSFSTEDLPTPVYSSGLGSSRARKGSDGWYVEGAK